ncbi:MAG: VgrG-related protein [Janthinobacterium lividum]
MSASLASIKTRSDDTARSGSANGRAADMTRTYFTMKLDGVTASDKLLNDILEMSVESSLSLPDMCTLRIQEGLFADKGHDDPFHWSGSDTFKAGTKVEVLGGKSISDAVLVFAGEVTSIEMDISSHSLPTLLIRCYDFSHRLHRGRFSRSFQNMTDSDIVQKVCQETGLTGEVDSTTPVHDWVFQNNQTNWEFLSQRAAHAGCRLFGGRDNKIQLKSLTGSSDSALTLTWGDDLVSFRPRINAASQVDEVSVHGWDPGQKQAILGVATTPNGMPTTGAQARSAAMSALGSAAKMMITDRPTHSQTEAEKMAQSICDDIGGQYVEAEGLTIWNGHLLPGAKVTVKNVGTRFSGDYFVTATTHVMSVAEGFTTLFSCTGKQPSTVLSLMGNAGGGTRAPLGGNIVVALVTNNKDASNLGRVKVKYPWLSDTDESYWARIATPMAGSGRGFYFLPEIDDEVLVAFEHGDIRRPYIVGSLWNGVDTPIEGNDMAVDGSNQVVHRIIKTRIGHTILLDDTAGTGEMKMTTKSGHFLTLNDRDQNITAQTKDGHKLLLDDQNKKIVVIDSSGQNSITIDTNSNNIECVCIGDFKVKATGNVNIQAEQGIQMSTPAQFKTSADAGVSITTTAQMQLKAEATMDIEATGPTTIKGAIVQIN